LGLRIRDDDRKRRVLRVEHTHGLRLAGEAGRAGVRRRHDVLRIAESSKTATTLRAEAQVQRLVDGAGNAKDRLAVERGLEVDELDGVVEVDGPVLAADVALVLVGIFTRIDTGAARANVAAVAVHALAAWIAVRVARPDIAVLAEQLAGRAVDAAERVETC